MIHRGLNTKNESHPDILKKHYTKTGQFRLLAQGMVSILMIIICIAAVQDVYGKTLYEYIDQNGDVILTDIPPPSGVKILGSEHVPDMTEQQKLEMEKEQEAITQKEALEEKEREKEGKIKTLKEAINKARSDVESYERFRDRAAHNARKNYWNSQIDLTKQEIKKQEETLKALESEP